MPDRNPDGLEMAVEALLAKFATEDPTSVRKWSLDDADPLRADEIAATEYVTPTQNLYQLTVLDGTGDGQRQIASSQRFQVVTVALRTYIYERTAADLGQSLVRHVRNVQDWIETFNANVRGRTNWWIDWRSWSSIRDESGRAPTPGARILLDIHLYQ